MKNFIFILSFVVCAALSTTAQSTKLKIKNQQKPFIDSSFFKKQPTQIRNKTNTQSNSVKSKKPSKVQQTKLDDLKNPFDTGKVKTVKRVDNYIGETEKN